MKNVQKTREQQVQLKHLEKIGFKIVDIAEMLAILATAALLLIGSAVTAKAKSSRYRSPGICRSLPVMVYPYCSSRNRCRF